jgi:hypothetical protein
MESRRMLPVLLLVAVVAASVSFAVDSLPNQRLAEKEDGIEDKDDFVPLPHPVSPPPQTAESSEFIAGSGFQLIGFTTQTFDGTHGILNLTLACQKEFPASRICTADDVRLTVNVPQAPGAGFAWIDVPPSRELKTRVDEQGNCRGWRSSAIADSGVAMDLEAAYGSLVHRPCNQVLRIACCAGN